MLIANGISLFTFPRVRPRKCLDRRSTNHLLVGLQVSGVTIAYMEVVNHNTVLASGQYKGLSLANTSSDLALQLYSFMVRLRRCEEALAAEYHPADEMRCPVHFCIGQEAAPAALSALLHHDDYLFSHHRSHGYYLAKSGPMAQMFAELYGKATGANGGKAGSQDISFPSERFYSGAILAGAVAIAVGAGLGVQLRQLPHVIVAGFGESATDEGIFWESVNYAGLRKLPVVFVCENNKYSVFSPQSKRQAGSGLCQRVETFGVKCSSIFGNDVQNVHQSLSVAIAEARSGNGPTFIELLTYRWSAHYGPNSDDSVGYRPVEELTTWKNNCPILLLEKLLIANSILTPQMKLDIESRADAEIETAFQFSKSSKFPTLFSWHSMNLSEHTPMADKLLLDLDWSEFDANQNSSLQKGY